MQGASPLASPGLNPRGTGSPCRCGKLNGGACLGVADSANVSGTRRGAQGGGRLPTLPSACFSAPIPPTPFPSGEGGDFRLFHARGFAPCIPGAGPGRHWLSLRGRCPAGACPVRGGFAPCIPGAEPRRYWLSLRGRHPAGACPVRGGASPSAPLRLSRERHWERGRSRHRRGAGFFGCRICLP